MSAAGVILRSIQEVHAPSFFLFKGTKFPQLSRESIMIYFAVPGASAFPLRVLESDSIASVKLRIQNSKGIEAKRQKLVYDGRELARNDSRVRDYDISDGNLLHLVIRISDLRVITVNTTCRKKFKVCVEKGRTVKYVKEQIAKCGNQFLDTESQKLIFDEEELDDQRMVHDICKDGSAAIHLLICKSATFKTKPIENDFQLSIITSAAKDKKSRDEVQRIIRAPPCKDVWLEPVIINPKVELPPVMKELVSATLAGLEKGNPPIMSSEGTGGAYFMQDFSGHKNVAIFKPIDEEPMAKNNPRGLPISTDGEGLKKGTRVGEGALREVAAYILDHPVSGRQSFTYNDVGFSGVPPTIMVRSFLGHLNHLTMGQENVENQFKIGSLQMFVKNYGSCEDMGPGSFPVQEVHKICVLDLRLANADRHGGNILVCKDSEEGPSVLVPIDHGYCLPESFEDCTFEWLYWPQSRQPFSSETIEYIRSLDAEQDIALLKFHGWELSVECSRTLCISTMLLKKGAERGFTPYDIGNILCRETINKESKIEEIIRQAKDAILPGKSETAFLECISEIMDRHLDKIVVYIKTL